MAVVPISASALRVNQPVPFALRDASGLMLVPRGGVVATEEMRKQLEERGVYIDVNDSEAFKKAVAGKMETLMRDNKRLGRIATAENEIDAQEVLNNVEAQARARRTDVVDVSWDGLLARLAGCLREPSAADFLPRLERIDEDLLELLNEGSDRALLTLIYRASTDNQKYSVHHALLVAVVVELASRCLPAWADEWRPSLRRAAMTMNIAMTNLQDQLASQDSALTPAQRATIKTHAPRGVAQLRSLGVNDDWWLRAVEQHHSSRAGPLADREPALQMARLIQRADVFAARLSPRHARKALSATAAAKSVYLDENQQADEAGAAIIKALGLYPPGSFVRLASREVAIVLRRGARATHPLVASVVAASGLPLNNPAVRDTRLKAHEIAEADHPERSQAAPERRTAAATGLKHSPKQRGARRVRRRPRCRSVARADRSCRQRGL